MKPIAERFVKWEPTPYLPRILDPDVMAKESGKNGGFSITLAEPADGRAFKVHFGRALVFRLANESYRLKTLESVQHELPWPTFRVENSELVEWFHDQTFGVYRDWPVQHFLFVGEDVVEVLSTEAPVIAEIKKQFSTPD
jgi:hypothetical protein